MKSKRLMDGGIAVPKAKTRAEYELLKVRKIQFSDHVSPNGQTAPDPLMLAARAAVTWCWRHNQKLEAAAEPQPVDVDDENWRDHGALEESRESREQVRLSEGSVVIAPDQPSLSPRSSPESVHSDPMSDEDGCCPVFPHESSDSDFRTTAENLCFR